MKNLIILMIFLLISCQSSFAGLNSSPDEMKYKKQKALNWYEANNKSGRNTEFSLLKDKALRWYKNSAAVFSNEINSLKNKSLRWHKANNK